MASSFNAREGDVVNEQPDAPRTDPQDPQQPREPTKEELIAAIKLLQEQIAALRAGAATEVKRLDTEVNQAQQTANLAGFTAQGIGQGIDIGQQVAGSANVRIPQPQRFKGNRDGPRVLEWAHQATLGLLSQADNQTASL